MNYSRNNSRSITRAGFTLVETLVAIAILMISIAGPLVIASKGLNAALYAKDQMIASYLAQDKMEMIKNKRDNNIIGSVANGWLTGMEVCLVDAPIQCDVTNIDGGFTRYYYLLKVGDGSTEVIAHVVVNWTTNNVSNEVDLASVLTNSLR